MEQGEIWAYRAKQRDALTPVQVLRLGTKRPPRIKIRFEDDRFEGREEWVSPARLKVLWADRAGWLAGEQRWEMARAAFDRVRDRDAERAATMVFEQIVAPWGIAEQGFSRNDGLLFVRDAPALVSRLGLSQADVVSDSACFQTDDGRYVAPWPVLRTVAEAAARLHADAVLAELAQDEQRNQADAVHGHFYASRGGPGTYISPEVCAEVDRQWDGARALVRQWCGAEAVGRVDERRALRAEVSRLRSIAQEAIDALRSAGQPRAANRLERGLRSSETGD